MWPYARLSLAQHCARSLPRRGRRLASLGALAAAAAACAGCTSTKKRVVDVTWCHGSTPLAGERDGAARAGGDGCAFAPVPKAAAGDAASCYGALGPVRSPLAAGRVGRIPRRLWGSGGEKEGDSGGPLEKFREAVTAPIRKLFGGGVQRPARQEAAPLFQPSLPSTLGLKLFTMFAQSIMKLFGGLLQEAQGSVGAVQEAACDAIVRSGRLGSQVECGQIFSQSYVSTNFNSRQTTRVQLQFQVVGELGDGMASCTASVGEDGSVEFSDLRLDGSAVDTTGGDSGGSGVIDVER